MDKIRGGDAISREEINAMRRTLRESGWAPKSEEMSSEDAHECLTYLLDKLHSPLFSTVARSSVQIEKESEIDMGDKVDEQRILQMAIPQNGVATIQSLLVEYPVIEEIDHGGEKENIVTKQTLYLKKETLPKYLPINLKRMNSETLDKNYSEVHSSKIIEIPIEGNPGEFAVYKLSSVVVHTGDCKAGHYTTYRYLPDEKAEMYVEYDDEKIIFHKDLPDVEDKISKNGYIFFYELQAISKR